MSGPARAANWTLDSNASPISAVVDDTSGRVSVTLKATGTTWSQGSSGGGSSWSLNGAPIQSDALNLSVPALLGAQPLTVAFQLVPASGELKVTISGATTNIANTVVYPYPFFKDDGSGYAVLPYMGGFVVPTTAISWVQPSSHSRMEWVGGTDANWNEGWMAIADPADDMLLVKQTTTVAGNLRLGGAFQWQGSNANGSLTPNLLSYSRTATFTFYSSGGYVAQAKHFRDFAAGKGWYVTLRSKAAANPDVNKLMGAPVIYLWGDGRSDAMLDALAAAGIHNALIQISVNHVDQNNFFPNQAYADGAGWSQAVRNHGWVPGIYDIYATYASAQSDPPHIGFYFDWAAGGAGSDSASTTWAYMKSDLTWDIASGRANIAQDKAALFARDTRLPVYISQFGFDAYFFDTTCANPPQEDYASAYGHSASRAQDVLNRAALLAAASGSTVPNHNKLGATEQAKSWAVPYLDWTEGMFKLGTSNAPQAYGAFTGNVYPEVLTDVKDPGSNLASVLNTGYQVPLWELVYHDALLSVQHWHLAHNKLLYCWDFADLSAMIRGQAPILHLVYNGEVGTVGRVIAGATDAATGKFWDTKWTNPNVPSRVMQTYNTVCAWQGIVGELPMINHQILSTDSASDYLVQNSEFSDDGGASGYGIVVNVGSYPGTGYAMTGPTWSGTIRGNSLTVPVGGYATYSWGGSQVASPVFNPGAGTYRSALTVAISTTTSGATIRYTTDGSNPSATNGTLYTSPIAVNASTTLKAIGTAAGLTDSAVSTAIYTINLTPTQVAAPVFSPVGGTFASPVGVTITSATSGATIRYTTDGSSPTATTGTIYSAPITISATATLKAIAYEAGLTDSAVTTDTYTIAPSGGQPAAAPAFSPVGGSYTSTQVVTIASTTPGAVIHYTVDGSTPTGNSGTLYAAPVSIASNTVLRAVASASGMSDSSVTTDTYTISSGTTTVTLPSIRQEDGWILEANVGSGTGGTVTSNDATTAGLRMGDDATNRQYRSIVSFDTSTLPASTVVDSATLLMRRGIVSGSVANLGTLKVDISTGGFGGNASLQASDFQATATAAGVATVSVPANNGQIAGGSLNTAGLAAINLTGRTQFRLAFTTATNSNAVADYLGCYASDNATPTNWPALQIVYHIAAAPVFTSQPASVTATVGDVVTLAAGASGSPTPTYQWLKEGVALPGATASTLTIGTATTADAGTYTVVATNSLGSATSTSAVVTINKLAATVTLGDLDQSYDGTPKTISVNTVPAGLAVQITYDGSSTPPSAIGQYGVVASVVDTDFSGSASGQLTIRDTTPPVIAVPDDIIVEATSAAGSVVNYDATATDLVSGAVSVAGSPASGSTFPLGITTVNLSAVDAAGNTAGATFKVTVRDTTAPVIASPGNRVVEAAGASGAAVSFIATALDTVSGTVPVVASPVSGSTFPIGTTTVNLVATDAAGNNASSTFTVTVVDTIPPVIATPANVTIEATGPDGAIASYNAMATDAVSGAVAVLGAPASGSTFPLGTTSINLTAADGAGNVATSSFTVTVVDTTAPTITVPADITAEATSAAGAVVNYDVAATDLVSGAVSVVGSPASGSTFPLGTTTVNLTTIDAAGNAATATFSVTVRDTTAPVLSPPANLVYDASSILGAVVTYSASATDAVSGNVSVTLSPASGTVLPVGETVVTATASDAAGNIATGSFVVTVRAPVAALLNHLSSVNGAISGSVRVNSGDSVVLNGGASISGELVVPGTPTLRLNGNPTFGGVLDGTGSNSPSSYTITLNGGSSLSRVVRRIDSLALPAVAQPASPAGTRSVTINTSSQTPGDFSTLRDLTMNSGAGTVTVPGGTYGNFTANGSAGFILGVAGSSTPTVYAFQNLVLNSGAVFHVAGPVVVTVKNGFNANAAMGDTAHPDWLVLNIASGGLTLNGGVTVAAKVVAPTGTVTVNGGATLSGGLTADRLTLNGGAQINLSLR